MKKIVFICHGNSFRSPIAEAIFNKNPKEGWRAYSYGTLIKEEQIEGDKISEVSPMMDIVINEIKKRGMDVSTDRSHRLFPEDLKDADKVIVMSEPEYTPDWLSDRGDERWEIPNPEIVTKEVVDDVINLLTEKIEELKKTL